MSGIDTSTAALQVSRSSALQPIGTGASTGAMQTGVSALAGGAPKLLDVPGVTPQQASTQTMLSALALALDAIVRSGGEATPAVVGTAPVWPEPDAQMAAELKGAADAAVTGMLTALADTSPDAMAVAGASDALLSDRAAAQTAGGGTATSSTDAAATAGTSAAAQATATQGANPLAALAASLQRTVSGSGLFYESHLAQWLLGQRSPAELAAEPQNRLVASASAQLPLDWRRGAGAADDVFWTDPHLPDAPAQASGPDAARAANPAQAMLFDDGLLDAPSAQSLVPVSSGSAGDAVLPLANPQGQPVAVHPAVIPVLRQQLDVLATGEFRWTGEAWPGVRLDWSIRQDGDDPRRSRTAFDSDATPWRTRLTLSLPSLGIVDAELTLVGATLAVRVQASGDSAARLAANGDALRGRMAAAGIELGGLSIREVGGAAPGSGNGATAAAAEAARAYAQAADAAQAAASGAGSASGQDAPPPDASSDFFDVDAR